MTTLRPGQRLRHLDGLRGVAILLVLIAHFAVKSGGSGLEHPAGVLGSLGVHVFLALSGYLITGLLVREFQVSGRVRLRDFYARRSLRILPAFWVMLAGYLLIARFSDTVDIAGPQALAAGLFLTNYWAPVPDWWTGHTWTLALEEQFYLLWPLALAFLRPRRAFVAAIAGILLEPVIRTGSYLLGQADVATLTCNLHLQADALMFGAVLALLPTVRPDLHRRLVDAVARFRLGLVAIALLALNEVVNNQLGLGYQLPIGLTVEGLCLMTVIAATERPGLLRRALAVRPLVWLGMISFSLYLWQQLFSAPDWRTGPLANTAVCVVLALAAAVVSRYLVERPALRLKARFEPPAAPEPIVPAGARVGTRVES